MKTRAHGFSVIEALIASALMAFGMMTLATYTQVLNRGQKQSNLTFQADLLKRTLITAVNANGSWTNIIASSDNQSSAKMSCLSNSSPCTTDLTTDILAGGTPISNILIPKIYDSSNSLVYDASSPTAGVTAQGTPCNSFMDPADGVGNDQCPLRYEVRWSAECTSSTCVNPKVQVQILAKYNPSTANHLAFNPNNYGTPFFTRGQDPSGVCWKLAGSILSQTCATMVGMGTASPTANLDVAGSLHLTGTVAIGTTTPETQFHLKGNINEMMTIESNDPEGVSLWLLNSTPGAHSWAVYSTGSGNGSGVGLAGFWDKENLSAALAVSGDLNTGFFTIPTTNVFGWGTGSGIPRAGTPDTAFSRPSIRTVFLGNGADGDHSGTFVAANIGVGVTNPTTSLQVQGEITPATDNVYTIGDATHRFTAAYASDGTIQTSDARAKRDIVDSDLGLDFIKQLRPVSYSWRSAIDPDLHYGLIAQEIEAALRLIKTTTAQSPIVSRDMATDSYEMNYNELIAPMIKAIQELDKKRRAKQRSIKLLLQENASLKREVSKLKQMN